MNYIISVLYLFLQAVATDTSKQNQAEVKSLEEEKNNQIEKPN